MRNIEYPDGSNREEWLKVCDNLTPHDFYKHPVNKEQKIWRYMDFAKFVNLISSQKLFFSAAKNFSDQFEGSVSKENIRQRPIIIENYPSTFVDEDTSEESKDRWRAIIKNYMAGAAWRRQQDRSWTYINCWHENDDESAAMWQLYGGSNQAIAVQSTFSRLNECVRVHRTPVGAPIIISQVHYLNYSTETVPVNYMYSEFFCKRMSFSHERELRVIFQELPLIPDPNATNGQQITDYDKVPLPGKALEINLDRLIDKIYISPLAPEWFINVTTEILKKCGLDKEVISSTMDDNILY